MYRFVIRYYDRPNPPIFCDFKVFDSTILKWIKQDMFHIFLSEEKETYTDIYKDGLKIGTISCCDWYNNISFYYNNRAFAGYNILDKNGRFSKELYNNTYVCESLSKRRL